MIYIRCPDDDRPCGGIQTIYRHADALNRRGFPAAVVHTEPGFRCTWFRNQTRIIYADQVQYDPVDFIVFGFGASSGPYIAQTAPGIRKVLLNQGCYSSFIGYPIDKSMNETPYLHPEVVATITVSDDSASYLRYAFPNHRVLRIRLAIDPSLFYYQPAKRPQIAFIPRRNVEDARQVLNILKFRGALAEFDIAPIENVSHEQAAAIMRESAIFLSFSSIEGFGLPPAEAMACGCVTIGYHGRGGREFFRPEFSYPIEFGDIELYARTAEMALRRYCEDPVPLLEQAKLASLFIANNYSQQVEESDVAECWTQIAGQAA